MEGYSFAKRRPSAVLLGMPSFGSDSPTLQADADFNNFEFNLEPTTSAVDLSEHNLLESDDEEEEAADKTVVCDQCKREFTKSSADLANQLRNDGKYYCSDDCKFQLNLKKDVDDNFKYRNTFVPIHMQRSNIRRQIVLNKIQLNGPIHLLKENRLQSAETKTKENSTAAEAPNSSIAKCNSSANMQGETSKRRFSSGSHNSSKIAPSSLPSKFRLSEHDLK